MTRRVLVAFVALVGCGDNIAAIPLEELDRARLEAQCAYLTKCDLFETVEGCLAFHNETVDVNVREAVRAGKTRYDAANARECVDALAAASCNQTSREARVVADCESMFIGTLVGGDECAFGEECISGVCQFTGCLDACCRGTCAGVKGPSTIGEECETSSDCDDDAFCGTDKLCSELSAAGQPCTADTQCAYGAACIGAGIQPGTCRTLPLLGESCPYLRCAEIGTLCSPTTQTCVRSGPGAACTSDADCSFYSLCNTPTQRCEDVPTLGMSCVSRCSGPSWCDHDRATCAAQFENGAPCRSGDQCASLFCEEGPFFDMCAQAALCF